MQDAHCAGCAQHAQKHKMFDWTPCGWCENHLLEIQAEKAAAAAASGCLLAVFMTSIAVIGGAMRFHRSRK